MAVVLTTLISDPKYGAEKCRKKCISALDKFSGVAFSKVSVQYLGGGETRMAEP